MIHYIYKITLLCGSLKDHYYIGKHSTTRPKDVYYGSGTILRDYYKKYGRKKGVSFIKEILEYNSSYEENMNREREILGDLWKTDPLCINLCYGGYGPSGLKFTDEHIQKLRDSHRGKTLPIEQRQKISESNKGRVCSVETRAKISKANKNRKRKDVPWNKGKHVEQTSGKNNYQARTVIQYTIDGEFVKRWDCIADARHELNLGYSGISKCVHGDRKTAYGYIWKYES